MAVVRALQSETPPFLQPEETRSSDRKGDLAVVDGDFAMRESELQPVLRALRGAGIDIVAIHQHMAGEEPRIVFLHYWGVGGTRDLALGLRKALDQTDSGRVS